MREHGWGEVDVDRVTGGEPLANLSRSAASRLVDTIKAAPPTNPPPPAIVDKPMNDGAEKYWLRHIGLCGTEMELGEAYDQMVRQFGVQNLTRSIMQALDDQELKIKGGHFGQPPF